LRPVYFIDYAAPGVGIALKALVNRSLRGMFALRWLRVLFEIRANFIDRPRAAAFARLSEALSPAPSPPKPALEIAK
jgi:hypothetical protein